MFVVAMLVVLGAIALIGIIAENAIAFAMNAYVKNHINEEEHSAFGKHIFMEFDPNYLETLKKGKAH